MSAGEFHAARFWLPEGHEISLLDAGFMLDRSDLVAVATPEAKRLSELADVDCLVLIGEPGLGKTTEMKAECRRAEASMPDGDQALLVELGFTRIPSELRDAIFGSEKFQNWLKGDGRLHLFLDSLDEARLRLETAAKLLIQGLEDVPHDRLSLRLSCRSADRHDALEGELRGWFTSERFAVRELAPLTRSDVAAAAAAHEIDPKVFVNEVISSELQPLAMVPESLKFLVKVCHETGKVPTRRTDAFEQGLDLLCREPDEDRRPGRPSSSSRMAIGARVAAAMLLSGRSSIRTTPGSPGPDEATLTELTGGREVDRHVGVVRNLDVDEPVLKDVLATAIFTGAGAGRAAFAQASYAEFLSARWIADGGLSPRQRDDLLFAAVTGRVVPQLREIAVWLAELSPEFEAKLLDRDPLVLLRSEAKALDNAGRARALEALLEAVRELRANGGDQRLRRSFSSLAFPGLEARLREVLADETDSAWAREIACDLAAACSLTAMVPLLTDLALDRSTDIDVRVAATISSGELADDSQLKKIRSLAMDELAEDQDDELKAAALEVLWPRILSVDDLTGSLTEPKNDHFFGGYRTFLGHKLVDGLRAADLAAMLHWSTGLPANRFAADELSTLRQQLMVAALPRIADDEKVRTALIDVLVPLLRSHANPLANSGRTGRVPKDFPTAAGRRALVRELVPLLARGQLELVDILFSSPRLLRAEDFDWLIERLRDARGDRLERSWAELIDRLPLLGGSEMAILEAGEWSPILAEISAPRFEAVALDSELADQLRDHHATELEISAEEVEEPDPDLDIAGRVKASLDDFERGHRNGFWIATKWLEIDKRRQRQLFVSDLTAMTGWSLITDEDRRRLVRFAASYLLEGGGEPERWFRQHKIYWPDWAAYRSLRLLADLDPETFADLDRSIWERWAAVVVGWFRDSTVGSDETAFNDSMLQHLFANAPREGAVWFTKLLDLDLRADRPLISLHRVERVWAPEIEDVLLRRARRSRRNPQARTELLRTLVANGSADGIDHARRLVVPSALMGTPDRRVLAAEVAMMLLEQRGVAEWERVWSLMRADTDFGCDLVSRLAESRVQIAANLPAGTAADLYLWAEGQFPSADDPRVMGVHSPSVREEIGRWRWGIIGVIAAQGTREAVDTLARLAQQFPEMIGIKRYLRDAEEIFERSEWEPPRPADVVILSEDGRRRYVRSDRELREVLISAFERCQEALQGQEGVASLLWDSKPVRPKPERQIALWLADRLKGELGGQGVFIGRELEIKANPRGRMGKSVDIICQAVTRERFEEPSTVRVVIELKGCWNPDLDKAMGEQLVDRYLDGVHRQGIYVVAYFDSPDWDESDSANRRRGRRRDLATSRAFFEQQAKDVSADGTAEVSAYVIDCSL